MCLEDIYRELMKAEGIKCFKNNIFHGRRTLMKGPWCFTIFHIYCK